MFVRLPKQVAALAVLGAFVLAGCGAKRARPVAPPPPAVQTVAAATGTVSPTLNLPGIIAPLQDVALSTTLAEPADAVNVQEGDHVTKGQVLAVLDTADLRATLASDLSTAQSDRAKTSQSQYTAQLSITQGTDQVRSAQAALQQAQQTLRNDQANLNRDQQLLASGFIAQATVDQQSTTVRNDGQAVSSAQANLTNAEKQVQVNGNGASGLQAANVAAARAEADAAAAQADQIRTQISKATIVAPVSGVVVNRNLNPGEYPGNRQLFTIQELDDVYAVLNATTSDAFSAKSGAPVSIVAQGQPKPFIGRVVAVLDQLTPGSTNFAIKVRLPNPAGILHSGMPVTGKISLPSTSGITIPTTAFLDDTHTSVLAVGGDNVAHTMKVSEVRSDGSHSIVRGLTAGTSVVANGQAGIADGQHVTVAQANTPQ
ncbi:MAG TPA: efflux RND transporter periplasmic adaptor subunit [Candidatus Acidoferrales bacterium]|nr:efflux RND transporter periplasmic adaptor subunit [Candidatus Acidoferrales bacterium]